MKNLLILLALLVFVSAVTVGCGTASTSSSGGGGGGGSSGSVIGTWNTISPDSKKDDKYTFNNDGSYSYIGYTGSQASGKWSATSTSIELDGYSFTLEFSADGNTMIWKESVEGSLQEVRRLTKQ